MHQVLFRLGLCPRHRWGDYSAPPEPLAGRATCKGDGRKIEEGKGGKGRGRKVVFHHLLLSNLTTGYM